MKYMVSVDLALVQIDEVSIDQVRVLGKGQLMLNAGEDVELGRGLFLRFGAELKNISDAFEAEAKGLETPEPMTPEQLGQQIVESSAKMEPLAPTSKLIVPESYDKE